MSIDRTMLEVCPWAGPFHDAPTFRQGSKSARCGPVTSVWKIMISVRRSEISNGLLKFILENYEEADERCNLIEWKKYYGAIAGEVDIIEI